MLIVAVYLSQMPKTTKKSQSTPRTAIAIMAAGKGTRLKSKHPKVLHQVGGKPLLGHVIAAASQVVPVHDIFAIIGHEANRVREAVKDTGVKFVLQSEQRGTGHALMVAREALAPYDLVIVLSGDAPLISTATIKKLQEFHLSKNAAMTLLTAKLDDPSGYGRVIRKGPKSDDVKAIIEQKALSVSQKKIPEINAGFYAFAIKPLFQFIDKLSPNNAHGEFYLTDMASVLGKAKQRVVAVEANNACEVLGGNSRVDMAEIDEQMRAAKCRQLMLDGVNILYPKTCVIDNEVEIGADTTIEPYVQILGKSKIGSECRIRSYSVIQNSEIADNVTIRPGCILDEARVSQGAILGPYSHLRPGSDIGEGAHVGNFVETKKVRLGKGSKANHLTYLGNAEIGAGVNIGAGTITCNYDGVHKHKTIIEDGVFVGSDSTLVAPVKLGKGAYIGAGSCITDDVPEESLAVARGRQIVKEGWVRQRKQAQAAKNNS
jgi:bifunctional UDP-N-acetylglucosamine pyrophosphorylase/glucosamine-1-phosphate N-acetyltransferase